MVNHLNPRLVVYDFCKHYFAHWDGPQVIYCYQTWYQFHRCWCPDSVLSGHQQPLYNVLTLWNGDILIFLESESQQNVRLQCGGMICNTNPYLYFGKKKNNQHIMLFLKKTRQHSTQSVGNMPPPSPPHLLPQVLQIMPRNPKYDQFQPKGHHNEENPQSTTKMPGNPKFYPFH